MKTILDASIEAGATVLLRTDFDVPVDDDGRITQVFRIEQQRPLIVNLLARDVQVRLIAHHGSLASFAPMVEQITTIIGHPIEFAPTLEEFRTSTAPLVLLENVRSWPGETKNDDAFAQELAIGSDLYINNAFAVCHRAHASVSAITRHLPSYAGPVIESEIKHLEPLLTGDLSDTVVVMGGAKASTKIPVIRRLVSRARAILVGGVIANDFTKARGQDVGRSVVDDHLDEVFTGLDIHDARIIVPEDFVDRDGQHLDIGLTATDTFVQHIRDVRQIIWNGPMGMFEDPAFAHATRAIAEAIIASGVPSVIGGGDTIAAVDQLGLLRRFPFVSTGGGAMLYFLAGEQLPGLVSLGYDVPTQ